MECCNIYLWVVLNKDTNIVHRDKYIFIFQRTSREGIDIPRIFGDRKSCKTWDNTSHTTVNES